VAARRTRSTQTRKGNPRLRRRQRLACHNPGPGHSGHVQESRHLNWYAKVLQPPTCCDSRYMVNRAVTNILQPRKNLSRSWRLERHEKRWGLSWLLIAAVTIIFAQQRYCPARGEAMAESQGWYPLKDGLIEFQLLRQPFQLRNRSREAGNVVETHEHAGDFKEF
jgi:hypothetical protein